MVKVYNSIFYDPIQDGYVVQPFKSTRARLAITGAKAIEDTEEEVPETALDEDGRYKPISS